MIMYRGRLVRQPDEGEDRKRAISFGVQEMALVPGRITLPLISGENVGLRQVPPQPLGY